MSTGSIRKFIDVSTAEAEVKKHIGQVCTKGYHKANGKQFEKYLSGLKSLPEFWEKNPWLKSNLKLIEVVTATASPFSAKTERCVVP